MTATTHTPNDMAADTHVVSPAHRRRDMSETNLQILRNLHVHGPQTPGDLARVMPTQQRSGITIALHVLAKPGYVMQDKTTKEPTWHITGTGRQRLAPVNDGLALVPKREKATSARRYLVEQHRLQARQRLVEQGTYHPEPFTDSARQGATDHEALPSRYGQRLHWRDGRITDLAGHQLLDPAGNPITNAPPADYRPLTRSLYA